MKRIGLTLGKFAPLHKGHQLLIETALQENDHVIVVIYDAKEVTTLPLSKRAAWIRKLYPAVEVVEGKDGPTVTGNTDEIKKIQEGYIFGLLNGRKITNFYSSEFYGDHMSKALEAVNKVIDEERIQIPVSATMIRSNPYLYRDFLSLEVYKDLITNVVFLGAPSTGKTTIAKALAEKFNTEWMPEYGREYWEKHQQDRRLTLEQLVDIAEGHIKLENEKLAVANNYLFTDTNAITTYMFSMQYHGRADARLERLAEEAQNRYDIVFVCDTDIPYEDTWDRSGDVNRMEFQKKILDDLRRRNINYTLIRGNLEERIGAVKMQLEKFEKY